MFLGAPHQPGSSLYMKPPLLNLFVPLRAWCMGTLSIWGMKIESVKAQKDMCGKIYIERINYFIFWVNFTDYNIDQLLSQKKTIPLPKNTQFYFANLFENKGIDTLQQVILLISLPTFLVTQLLYIIFIYLEINCSKFLEFPEFL